MPAPIVLQDQSGLAQGIAGAGSALAGALGQRMQEKRMQQQQQQYGTILESTLGSLPENATPIQITQAMTDAIKQGVPNDVVQKYGTLYATLQKAAPNNVTPEQIDKMAGLFEKFGMSPEESRRNAELYGELTVGGQTEMAKYLVDNIARGSFSGQPYQPPGQQPVEPGQPTSVMKSAPEGMQESVEEVEEFQWPKVEIFSDKTPKERASMKADLLKSNIGEYKENEEKLRATEGELMRYNQLEKLNDSGKLPEGLQRLNINWTTGDIRIPALANEEAQLFVKTINDFTVAAKDSFGARVTNFELGAFLKRLPTLANSEAGRRLILEQVKTIKELDKLYHDSIRDVYDHYGAQGIDRASAEKIARDLRADDEKALKERFDNSMFAQKSYVMRQQAPEGTIPVIKPDGSEGYLPFDQADKAKKKGWKVL